MMVAAGLSGPALWWSLAVGVVLLVLNAIYVAYEFALLAAKRSAFEAGAENGERIATASLDSLSDLSNHLAGSQLGITMATLGLGNIGEPAVASLFERAFGDTFSPAVTGTVSFVCAISITVFLHLVLAEMVPKNIAIARPEQTVRWLVLPYRVYLAIFRPFVRFLNALGNAGCRAVGIEPRDEITASHSTAELASIVRLASEEGGIETDSAELLQGALAFAERPVGEVARPIESLATIRFGATAAVAERVVTESGETRVPIVSGTGGDGEISLVGYLHVMELLKIPAADRHRPIPASMTRQMAVVRADRPLIEVLRIMRLLRRQLAVVASDDGPQGLISVEEVVEALASGGSSPAAGAAEGNGAAANSTGSDGGAGDTSEGVPLTT